MAEFKKSIECLLCLRSKLGWRLLFAFGLSLGFILPVWAQDTHEPVTSIETGAVPLTSEQHSDFGALSLLKDKSHDAIKSYTAALKDQKLTNDRRASLLNDRAVAYARDGQIKSALEDFNAAAQLYPEYAPIYNNRGTLLVSLEHYKEALKDFNRALLLTPTYAAAFNNRGTLYLKLGKKGEAFEDFNRALELAPQSQDLLNSRGRANLEYKRPYAAIRDFTHSVSLDDRFPDSYRYRGLGKLMIQAYPEAIEDFTRALAFKADDPELYALRGEAYEWMGELSLALKDFNRSIVLDPKFEMAYVGRGLTLILMDKKDEAISDLNQALELNPRSVKALAIKSLAEIKKGEVDQAQKDITTALEIDGKVGEIFWVKAVLNETLDQKDQALRDLAQALELKPWLKDALDQQIRLAGGKIDQSLENMEDTPSGSFRVIRRNGQFFALNDLYPRLILPLETTEEDVTPKIAGWEIKQAPFQGYGVLRYAAGNVLTSRGLEESEMAVLVDISQQRVVSVLPERQGSKSSIWKWDNDKIRVSALDGLTDEFPLLGGSRVGPVASQKGEGVSSVSRRYATESSPDWAPWNQPLGMPESGEKRRRKSNYNAPQSKGAKSFFDLLFN